MNTLLIVIVMSTVLQYDELTIRRKVQCSSWTWRFSYYKLDTGCDISKQLYKTTIQAAAEDYNTCCFKTSFSGTL